VSSGFHPQDHGHARQWKGSINPIHVTFDPQTDGRQIDPKQTLRNFTRFSNLGNIFSTKFCAAHGSQ